MMVRCAKEKQCEKRKVVGGYGTCDAEGKATAVLLPPSRSFLPLLLHSELTELRSSCCWDHRSATVTDREGFIFKNDCLTFGSVSLLS